MGTEFLQLRETQNTEKPELKGVDLSKSRPCRDIYFEGYFFRDVNEEH